MHRGLWLILSFALLAQAPRNISGDWDATLAAGGAQLRLVLHLTQTADGLYLGKLDSVDQSSVIPIDRVTLKGDALTLELKAVNGVFEGTVGADGGSMKGTWTQGASLPLEFKRRAPSSSPATSPAVASTPARLPMGLPFSMHVPMAPRPVLAGNGNTILAWELHITNYGNWQSLMQKVEVLGDGKSLLTYEGSELNGLIYAVGGNKREDKRTVGPGGSAVVFLWLPVHPGTAVPTRLTHRISVGEHMVESAPLQVSTAKPPVLGPPLEGDLWVAANGPSRASVHRRAINTTLGKAWLAQRFAIDWVRVNSDGKTSSGNPKDNKNYLAYGSPVLAVSDAVVSALKDGIEENEPGENSRAVPITLETIGGNYLILDLGDGHFAFYAHLQPGSLKVKMGDRVKKGQALALLGNSGNSTEPHLHFHVSDGNSAIGSEGVPFVFESYEMLTGPNKGQKRNSLPLQNAAVTFAK